MKKKRLHEIDRRTFLKGLGGAVVALPLFDFFLDSHGMAYAQTASAIPKRYLVVANGISLTKAGNYTNYLLPTRTGLSYDLRNGLTPLGLPEYAGLQSYVSVLTNLRLPSVIPSSTSPAPLGGFKGDFHAAANRAQMTGRQSDATTPAAWSDPTKTSMGPSSDQALKAALNPAGAYVHMNYSAQPKVYIFTGSSGRAITQFGPTGTALQPQSSPSAAFDELFFNQKSTDAAAEAQRLLAVEQRKSVLDLIDKDLVNYLNRELGASEKALLASHFEQIRDLEVRINNDSASQPPATCVKPVRPVDPPLGPNYQNGTTEGQDDAAMAYSNEDRRADLFIDLIHMALTCDIARHGTLRLTYSQSWMNSKTISGMGMDYHELSHTGAAADVPFLKMVQWHVNKFCKLANKLRTTNEGSGKVLDNCALVFTSEGGGGVSSDTGTTNSPHCGDNMASLVAGRAGGLTTGAHIATSCSP